MITDNTDTQARPVLSRMPEGKLAIIPLSSMTDFGQKVNEYLVTWRNSRVRNGLVQNENEYARDTYLLKAATPRFSSGEAKGTISESVRGDDLYIMVDVMNRSITYRMAGFENLMSADDHFQDLKRIIATAGRNARRINVIMPYIYEGRQTKPNGRESSDCANAMQELVSMGVSNIITFDAHDDRVQNAIPMDGFETIRSTYQFIKYVLKLAPDLKVDSDHLAVVSPDEGGMRRAIYLANVLGVDMGMFYKRRDYSTSVNGSNPIIAHEFLGPDVEGKDIIIIDDMISSGEGVLETSRMLKQRKAGRIFICTTFGIFTNGIERFNNAYEEGLFDHLLTTNLVYQPEELLAAPYYTSCDMTKFVALIIDTLNHDSSLSSLLDPLDRINRVLKEHADRQKNQS
ncbi:MAG: ribose-phosphate pyrophosphokinase [Lachnospiraceae bacterium]|nr:ribose-phosphate pyrophosphokinase [Lachnospiraceae bacterium]